MQRVSSKPWEQGSLGGVRGVHNSELDEMCVAWCAACVQVSAQVPGQQQAIKVMLAIEVEPHPEFSRRGFDIIYPLTLRLSEALAGK